MVLDTVAGKEEVLERAKELLDRQGIDITMSELKDIYESTHKFIEHSLNNEEYATVKLGDLGVAYYIRKSLSKLIARTKGDKKEFWRNKRDLIDIFEFDKNLDRLKGGFGKGKVVHTMQTFKDRNHRWKFPIEKIEQIQNKIL